MTETRWLLTAAESQALRDLKVYVTVDTDAAPVIHAIEEAAEKAGLVLARLERPLCGARWDEDRAYPCSLPRGHEGPHLHPMDPA